MPNHPQRYHARQYAKWGIQNTDLLAFRFVEESRIVTGKIVLDLGCGAGRSTRFLKSLGNKVTGLDVDPEMVALARTNDPAGDYHHNRRDTPFPFRDDSFDAVFSSWMILELGDPAEIVRLLERCHRILRRKGEMVIVTNTPDFYSGDWLSCKVDYPENQPPLKSGQRVKAVLLPDEIEVHDYFWSDADYQDFFTRAGFRVLSSSRPLGTPEDGLSWKDESLQAPYVIYRLKRA